MRCSGCRHFKDRYTLYLDGDFPVLQQLLDKGLVSSKDFMCEGYGCIFNPCLDFTNAGHGQFMGKPFEELDNDMEKKCENFEPRRGDERILVKNLYKNPIRDRKYYVFDKGCNRLFEEGKK